MFALELNKYYLFASFKLWVEGIKTHLLMVGGVVFKII